MVAPSEPVGQDLHGDPIQYVRLTEVDTAIILKFANDPRTRRHMPLASGEMSEADVREWVSVKDRYWDDLGFGPWGILIGGTYAGWGGLQPFNGGDVEVALVLRPEFWGWGKRIFLQLIDYAFRELDLPYVVVALPPTRGAALGLLRLGFQRVGSTTMDGHSFFVYRLDAPATRGTR